MGCLCSWYPGNGSRHQFVSISIKDVPITPLYTCRSKIKMEVLHTILLVRRCWKDELLKLHQHAMLFGCPIAWTCLLSFSTIPLQYLFMNYIPIPNVRTGLFAETIFQQRGRPWIERVLNYWSLRKGKRGDMNVLCFCVGNFVGSSVLVALLILL